jgi:syntaxin 5
VSTNYERLTAAVLTSPIVARRKTLFDDRPVEISELTYIIKHDIAAINRQLSDLQAFNKSQRAGGAKGKGAMDKAEEHRGNVVTLLQTKLAGATTDFQDILEVRTQVRMMMRVVVFLFC